MRLTQRRSWAVLALALVAQVLVVLDISVVNTALPTIGDALSLSSSNMQWLVTAYLLISGGGLLLGGRIADLLPRRRVFLTGMAIFTTASLFSGFASTAAVLIGARAAQGLGAALMTPAALSLIMTTYSGAQRAKGLALWGAVGGLGIAAGVLVGGALTTWAGWQAIFWVNVPIGIVAIIVALRILPHEHTDRARLSQFDIPGAVTVVAGLAALMFGLAGTTTHGWASTRTIVVLLISAGLLAAFVVIERHVPRPLVPPHTWSVKSLVSGTAVMLGVTGLLVGAVFLTSIFMQTVLGFSALEAGLGVLATGHRARGRHPCGQPPDGSHLRPQPRGRRPGRCRGRRDSPVHGLQHGDVRGQPSPRTHGPRMSALVPCSSPSPHRRWPASPPNTPAWRQGS